MPSVSVRFGPYTFYPAKLELHKSGHLIKLPQQSALLLAMLIEKPGEAVTREQMRDRIWPEGTHVEFDFGLNTAINRIRRVLDDSARHPRYVETIHRIGYRFIAPCEVELPPPLPEQPPKPSPSATPPPAPSPAHRLRALPLAAALLLGLSVLAGAGWFFSYGRNSFSPSLSQAGGSSLRSTILLPVGHHPQSVRIVPSGNEIAYLVGSKIYLRRLDRDESIPLDGSAGTMMFAYSPDGSAIAMFKRDGIYVQKDSVNRRVAKFPHIAEIRSATWAGDGRLYYSDDGGEGSLPTIYSLPATGGEPEPVLPGRKTLGQTEFPLIQQTAPQGSLLISRILSPRSRSLYLRNAAGVETPLFKSAMDGRLLPTGHLLYFWANTLFTVGWDSQRLRIAGTPTTSIDGVMREGWRGAMADVSETGTLVYVAQPPMEQRQIVMVNESGAQTKLSLPSGEYEQIRVSPDEKRLAVVRKDSDLRWSVWIYEIQSKVWHVCTEVPIGSPRVVWSPDGEWLALGFLEGNSDFLNIYRLKVSNPSQIERLSERSNYGQFPTHWVAQNNSILYEEGVHVASKSDLYQVTPGSMDGKPLFVGAGWDLDATVSSDAKWLAYASETKDGIHTYIQPYEKPGPAIRVSPLAGRGPMWSRLGDKLWFTVFRKDGLQEIRIANGRPIGEAVQKFPGIRITHPDIWTRSHDLTPSGKLYAIQYSPRETRGRIELVFNWFSEVERQAPASR